jgi:poly(3-hydroxyalkanoate) depolymerase
MEIGAATANTPARRRSELLSRAIGSVRRIETISVAGQAVRVGITSAPTKQRPLLLFNGIGASLELVAPFAKAMHASGILCIVFDVPGVGGSALSRLPYRFSGLAKIAASVLDYFGIAGQVDVLGVSWGGALAQQFARQFPARCNRLILAATSPGAIMIPGRLDALAKMVSPRRYTDPDFMARSAGRLYGGAFRDDPELSESLLRNMAAPTSAGYMMQIAAMVGWTSIHWLHRLPQPTLILMGKDDPIVPEINGRILAQLIPNARLVTIDDGHLFLLTSIDAVVPIIDSFLRDAPSGADGDESKPS